MASRERTPHTGQPRARQSRAGRQHARDGRHSERRESTALETVASTFRMLTTGPDPLCVDGRAIGYGLPRRPIPLDELRTILLRSSSRRPRRDAAWQYLVTAARTQDPGWVVGAAGVALPALQKIARELSDGYRGDRADLASAVLTGFIDGIRRVDVDRPGVITRLRWMAYRAGVAARYTRDGILSLPLPPLESQPPPSPWAHPDLILLDAVAKGVLSPVQAELIGRTRLEDMPLMQAALELGLGYEAACKARQRGEARLTAAITSGDVEHRLSAPATDPGLTPAGGESSQPENPEPGVRGASISSDDTPETDGSPTDPDEEGVFCGPARQPPHPAKPIAKPTVGHPTPGADADMDDATATDSSRRGRHGRPARSRRRSCSRSRSPQRCRGRRDGHGRMGPSGDDAS